jgi:hypothetical protein
MATRAVGKYYGVSKSASITIVKLARAKYNPAHPPDLEWTKADFDARASTRSAIWVDAFARILADVTTKGLGRKSVISFSNGIGDYVTGVHPISQELGSVINELLAQDVLIVCSSGNGGDPAKPLIGLVSYYPPLTGMLGTWLISFLILEWQPIAHNQRNQRNSGGLEF